MGNIQRYHSADLPSLMEKINKNSIGLDNYLESFFDFPTQSNYPPYNLIQLNNHESRLEVARMSSDDKRDMHDSDVEADMRKESASKSAESQGPPSEKPSIQDIIRAKEKNVN